MKKEFRIAFYNNLIYLDPSVSIGVIGYITDLDLDGIGLRWNFPEDKFIEYEPEDEQSYRLLNFGFETQELYSIHLNRVMLIHTDNYWSIYLEPLKANQIYIINGQIIKKYNNNTLHNYKLQLDRLIRKYPSSKIIINNSSQKLLNLEKDYNGNPS